MFARLHARRANGPWGEDSLAYVRAAVLCGRQTHVAGSAASGRCTVIEREFPIRAKGA
jgi:hypothetical protein